MRLRPTSIILSWSGGKDSALALHTLSQDPSCEVVGLLTSVTRDYDRISIHGVRRALLEAQAASIALPLYQLSLAPNCTNADYEAAFLGTLATIRQRNADVSHIAFGDLFLADVRAYRERMLSATGWTPRFPLWGLNTTALAHHFIQEGFEGRLVCVDTTQLDASFAGRAYDTQLLADLPSSVDPCGERGEFHPFVPDGPPSTAPIQYTCGEKVLRDDRFMYCDLL